jgi:hypothetical protein
MIYYYYMIKYFISYYIWLIKEPNQKPVVKQTERDSPPRGSLRQMFQQGAGISGEPLRGPVAASEPVVEISAKGKDEPVVQNLPQGKPKTTLMGVSSTDTLLQGASTSNTPAAGGLGHLVSRVGGPSIAEKILVWKR